MATKSMRIDEGLARLVERDAKLWDRSARKQLEHLVKIGRAISGKIEIADIFAISQGIKLLKVEMSPTVQSGPVDSDEIFSDLENDRAKGILSEGVTSARVYYETSITHPGHIDCVDSATGERQTGLFENGEFRQI